MCFVPAQLTEPQPAPEALSERSSPSSNVSPQSRSHRRAEIAFSRAVPLRLAVTKVHGPVKPTL